jgi:hypothetical protein
MSVLKKFRAWLYRDDVADGKTRAERGQEEMEAKAIKRETQIRGGTSLIGSDRDSKRPS